MIQLLLPTNGQITQYFGENPGFYAKWGYQGHNGVDFGVAQETPVYASADGKVDKTGYEDGGYGKYIRLSHEGGAWQTWYCHLSDNSIRPGRAVKAGEVIGFSGNTGASTGPHLHWGLSIPGRINPGFKNYFDPLKFMGAPVHPEQPPVTPPVVVPPTVEPGQVEVIEVGIEIDRLDLVNILDVPVNIRSGPGVQYEKVGEIQIGAKAYSVKYVTGTEIWVEHETGWSAAIYNGELYLEEK